MSSTPLPPPTAARPQWQSDLLRILIWLLASRALLTAVGVAARGIAWPVIEGHYDWVYSPHPWLDIWGLWDTGWYFSITLHGYPVISEAHPTLMELPAAQNYGFYPLYPWLVRAVHSVIPSLLVSSLIVSNAALLASGFLLLRWVERLWDRETAWRAVRYLFLFPASFIFSGAFSESVCLATMLAALLASEQRNYLAAGVATFFVALTRPVGIFIALPLAWTWWQRREEHGLFDLRGLHLAGVGFGTLAWMAVNYSATGDPLAFLHVKATYYGTDHFSPIANLLGWIRHDDFPMRVNAFWALAQIPALLWLLWRGRLGWFALALCLWAVPIGAGGDWQASGIFRFAIVIVPYYVMLAEWTRDPRVDLALSIALATVQGLLMALWVCGFRFIV